MHLKHVTTLHSLIRIYYKITEGTELWRENKTTATTIIYVTLQRCRTVNKWEDECWPPIIALGNFNFFEHWQFIRLKMESNYWLEIKRGISSRLVLVFFRGSFFLSIFGNELLCSYRCFMLICGNWEIFAAISCRQSRWESVHWLYNSTKEKHKKKKNRRTKKRELRLET